jgi:ABC-2 type transport system ATP-binding protein
MLTLKNFSKNYGDKAILKIDSLQMERGIHGVKGENGSGKSTLFRSIGGLIPFNGDIFCGQLNLRKDDVAFRKVVNYAEAEPKYPGFVTPKDLIRFVGKAKDASHAQQDFFTHKFGVDTYFEKPVETFSSGMLKKVSLVIAFLGNPKLILLDEPLITLDGAATDILLRTIKEMLEAGTTFLLSSHQNIENTTLTITATYFIENKTLHLERPDSYNL